MTEVEAKKTAFVEAAVSARNERQFLTELYCWQEIVDLDVPLSSEDIYWIGQSCRLLRRQLNADELQDCPAVVFIAHANAVVQLVNKLVPRLEPKQIEPCLRDRWNSYGVLQDYGHPDRRNAVALQNIALAKAGFAKVSPAHSKRISKLRRWIQTLENPEDELAELIRLVNEIESAEEDSTMTEKQRLKSIRLLAEMKRDIEHFEEKQEALKEAAFAANTRQFVEQLHLWQRILDMNVSLNMDERSDLSAACEPLSKQLPLSEYRKLKESEVIEHSEAVLNILNQLDNRPAFETLDNISSRLRTRWDNDVELQKLRNGKVDYDALAEEYVMRMKERNGPLWVINPGVIQAMLFFVAKQPKLVRRLEMIEALMREVLAVAAANEADGIPTQSLHPTLNELARIHEYMRQDLQPTNVENEESDKHDDNEVEQMKAETSTANTSNEDINPIDSSQTQQEDPAANSAKSQISQRLRRAAAFFGLHRFSKNS